MKHLFFLLYFLFPILTYSQILNKEFENMEFDADTASVCELYTITEDNVTQASFGLKDQNGILAFATLSNLKENIFLWDIKVSGNPGCIEKTVKGTFNFQGGQKILATLNKETFDDGLSCTGRYYFVLSPTENRELLKTFFSKDLVSFSIPPSGGKYLIKFTPKESKNIRELMQCMNP